MRIGEWEAWRRSWLQQRNLPPQLDPSLDDPETLEMVTLDELRLELSRLDVLAADCPGPRGEVAPMSTGGEVTEVGVFDLTRPQLGGGQPGLDTPELEGLEMSEEARVPGEEGERGW